MHFKKMFLEEDENPARITKQMVLLQSVQRYLLENGVNEEDAKLLAFGIGTFEELKHIPKTKAERLLSYIRELEDETEKEIKHLTYDQIIEWKQNRIEC